MWGIPSTSHVIHSDRKYLLTSCEGYLQAWMSDRLLTEQDMWLYSQCSSHISHRMSKTDNNNMIPSLGGQKCDNGEIKDAHSQGFGMASWLMRPLAIIAELC